jgi:hypothetical protein
MTSCKVVIIKKTAPKQVAANKQVTKVIESCRPNGMPGRPDIFKEIIADHTILDSEASYIFLNTNAGAMVNFNFAAISKQQKNTFIVTNAAGITLLPTGQFFVGGSPVPVTGTIRSTQEGAILVAYRTASNKIMVDATSGWEWD